MAAQSPPGQPGSHRGAPKSPRSPPGRSQVRKLPQEGALCRWLVGLTAGKAWGPLGMVRCVHWDRGWPLGGRWPLGLLSYRLCSHFVWD